jgi:hypothetical protein
MPAGTDEEKFLRSAASLSAREDFTFMGTPHRVLWVLTPVSNDCRPRNDSDRD